MMSKEDRIFVAGHGGMVGSAIVRKLRESGYTNLITRTRTELDLVQQVAVRKFFESERVDQVYLAAAKVAGVPCLVNDIGLDHQILIDEFCRIGVVGENCADFCCGQVKLIHAFPFKE